MGKTKRKINRKATVLNNLPAIILVSFLIIFIAALLVTKSMGGNSNTANTSSNNLGTGGATAEAKTAADKYFEAVRTCDLETANSLRLIPKTNLPTKEDCIKECPNGIQYKYISSVSYNKDRSDGMTTESANFSYTFGCGSTSSPTLVRMTRSSSDNKWLLLNTN